jgi:hypothetical protein
MPKRTLNDRTLKALKPAPKGETYDVMDAVVPGFGVRVSEAGRRTFILVARFGGARNPTRRALGEYGALTLAQGREKARDWLELIRRALTPARTRRAKGARKSEDGATRSARSPRNLSSSL